MWLYRVCDCMGGDYIEGRLYSCKLLKKSSIFLQNAREVKASVFVKCWKSQK